MKPFKIVSTGFKPDRFWLDSSGVNLLASVDDDDDDDDDDARALANATHAVVRLFPHARRNLVVGRRSRAHTHTERASGVISIITNRGG